MTIAKETGTNGTKKTRNDAEWEIQLGPSCHDCKVWYNGKLVKNIARIRIDAVGGAPLRVQLDLLALDHINVKVKPDEVILPMGTGIERDGKWG